MTRIVHTRRDFLKTASALAAPLVVPGAALGLGAAPAPSNRITLGFIGVGMMGQGHLHAMLGYPEAQVLAVCDVDRWRRENAQTMTEQTYAAEKAAGTYRGCKAYNDLRDLVARDDIDGVVIATGDRWHPLATVLSARAGKDVYCEKPISCTIAEARAMADVVRRYGRVSQTGLQQRSAREFRRACQLARDGALGKLKIVYITFPGTSADVHLPVEPVPEGLDWDLWLGPCPWRPFNGRFHIYGRPPHVVPWHFCRDFGGGNLTSNAVHAFDIVQWGLEMDASGPVEITPPGVNGQPVLTYKYANGVPVQVANGRLDPRTQFVPKGWDVQTGIQAFGAVFVGEDGWVHVGREGFLQAFPKEILQTPEKPEAHRRAVGNHHKDWLDAIRSRSTTACDLAIGCQSTIVSHLGCIAHWTGRSLKWDPAREEFLGDDEANRLRSRAMREPWTF